tara:strand:+ start:559 stop:1053 length:495 start_codon:yes stop_codon:yes gene_type:complete
MVNLDLIKHTFTFSGLSVVKNFFTKSYLLDYISSTSLLSFLYTKHLVKSVLYFILFLFTPQTRNDFIVNFKNVFLDYSNPTNITIIISTIVLAILEIGQAFPTYFGLSKAKLSSFIASSTIMAIIANVLLGFIVFKEVIKTQVIIGLVLSITGLYLILNSNGDS